MSSKKCNKCGLANFGYESQCRRCGELFYDLTPTYKKEKRARRFSVISLVIYAALAVGGYYLYQELMNSIAAVSVGDAQRVGTQPPPKAPSGLSRTEQDRHQAGQYGNAVKDNPSIQAKRKQEEETQRAMQQAAGGR